MSETVSEAESAAGEEIEIGILRYPGSMTSAAYGLAELFGSYNLIREREVSVGSAPALPHIQSQCWQLADDGKMLQRWTGEADGSGEPEAGKGAVRNSAMTALVVLPSLEGEFYLTPNPELSAWIRGLHNRGTIICSVCAGAFLVGAAGLLDGQRVTTHWNLADRLQLRFPAAGVDANRILIDNQDLITAGGVMAWLDLGLHLVERFTRPGIALELGKMLLIDTGRREQRFYRGFLPPLNHGDPTILQAQHYIHRHFDQPLSVGQLARHCNMVERTFYRNFQRLTGYNPGEYLQNMRIQKARELIETRPLSVEQVGWQVGYEDISAFRRMFRKLTGLSPGQYKQRFARC